MRPRIPLAYAGLLIVALVAIVGFAAFSTSPSTGSSPDEAADQSAASIEAAVAPVSARVASAILALRVSDADARLTQTPSTTAPASTTTEVTTSSTTEPEAEVEVEPEAELAESTSTLPDTTTTPPPPKDTTPPALKITSPSDGATVDDRVVTFEGTSEPGAMVTSGPYEANVEEDGDWSIKLVVSSEGSKATITAHDEAGNTTTKSITVTYDPPAAQTTTTTTNASPPPPPPDEPKWSPLWPADPGGRQSLEHWRPLVEQYWPANLVNCALNIIYFESHGDARAYNSSGPGFEGLFQHHSGYWKGRAAAAGFRDSNGLYATPYSAEANIAVAWYLANNSSPWDRHWSVDPHHPNAPYECTE